MRYAIGWIRLSAGKKYPDSAAGPLGRTQHVIDPSLQHGQCTRRVSTAVIVLDAPGAALQPDRGDDGGGIGGVAAARRLGSRVALGKGEVPRLLDLGEECPNLVWL